MKAFCFIAAFLSILFCSSAGAADSPDKAQQLAADIWKASGGEEWQKVSRIHFVFNVVQGDKTLAKAEHDWDVAAGTDRVKWKDKDVTVNLKEPAQDENGKAAYARWVNDSYWLLAPLKLRDPGVQVSYEGSKTMDNAACEVLHARFEKVGLTPEDQYNFYVDPNSKRVIAWDYIPKTGEMSHFTWENYQLISGIQFAMDHKSGDKNIRFTEITVALTK